MVQVSKLFLSASSGNRRDVGRLITILENRSDGYKEIIQTSKEKEKKSFILGVTGPPGVGKSSLIARIEGQISERERLAIIMIDATSPYSGGSLLGNRLRLDSLKNTYTRSMATRGSGGGLNLALGDVIDLLSALGYTMIIVESVGSGQDETDILYYSDKIVLVLAPGLGDQIQSIKAGQMEIGDFVVLNKGDKAEAIIAEKELLPILSIPDLAKKHEFFKVSSQTGEGIDKLIEAIMESERKKKGRTFLIELEKEKIMKEAMAMLRSKEDVAQKLASRIIKGDISREEALTRIFKMLIKEE